MPVPNTRLTLRSIGAAAAVALLTAGCANAPSVDVLGAYFPDWLFCVVAGVALTIVAHLVLARIPAANRPGAPAILYPVLVTLFALVVWLVFFQQ